MTLLVSLSRNCVRLNLIVPFRFTLNFVGKRWAGCSAFFYLSFPVGIYEYCHSLLAFSRKKGQRLHSTPIFFACVWWQCSDLGRMILRTDPFFQSIMSTSSTLLTCPLHSSVEFKARKLPVTPRSTHDSRVNFFIYIFLSIVQCRVQSVEWHLSDETRGHVSEPSLFMLWVPENEVLDWNELVSLSSIHFSQAVFVFH